MLYLQLFWEFFKTGLFAVGGGLATLPFLQDMADRTGWFTHAQLADMLAVSESTPGPIGVNMATYVGFTTGGIGGVHRGAETTMDISADLEELGRTPVAVVCAGAKSILDLGLTLEYLETKGVPVYGYQTLELPAFYTRTSGFQVDCHMDTPEEVAAALRASFALGMGNGSLIVNPIPETDSMDPTYINQVIQDAVDEANRQGVHGKAITPFLLGRIKDITGGKSLESNIALVYNNARLAAQIAAAL